MTIFATALADLQSCMAHGGELTFTQKRNLLACIRNGATGNTAAVASDAAVQSWKTAHDTFAVDATAAAGLSTTQNTATIAQWGLVDVLVAAGAPGYAALVTGLGVMKTALLTPMATLNTAVQLSNADGVTSAIAASSAATLSTAALAAAPGTLITNAVMDGT